MNDYNFGNFICILREKKGYTQADIAKMLNITPAAVSKWENGESKPRIETLFQLAEILDVRAEELIAGKYLQGEILDPNAVARINERYEYLRIIDSHAQGSVKLKRLLAWVLDWNITGFASMILTTLVSAIFGVVGDMESPLFFILTLLSILLYPVCFVLRDLIWGGRSLGKRITGLVVLDKNTAAKPKKWQLIVRNIFLFILHVDSIVMLVRGQSLGDSAAHTVVVAKKHIDKTYNDMRNAPDINLINSYETPPQAKKKSAVKIILIIVSIFLAFIVFVFGVVSIALGQVKKTEEYSVAYTYLINSQAFAEMDASTEDIIFNAYSSYTSGSGENATYETTISFVVDSHQMEVVCHKNGDTWYVCSDCTSFR